MVSSYKGLVGLSGLFVIFCILEQYIGKFGASMMCRASQIICDYEHIYYWKIIAKNITIMYSTNKENKKGNCSHSAS